MNRIGKNQNGKRAVNKASAEKQDVRQAENNPRNGKRENRHEMEKLGSAYRGPCGETGADKRYGGSDECGEKGNYHGIEQVISGSLSESVYHIM